MASRVRMEMYDVIGDSKRERKLAVVEGVCNSGLPSHVDCKHQPGVNEREMTCLFENSCTLTEANARI